MILVRFSAVVVGFSTVCVGDPAPTGEMNEPHNSSGWSGLDERDAGSKSDSGVPTNRLGDMFKVVKLVASVSSEQGEYSELFSIPRLLEYDFKQSSR